MGNSEIIRHLEDELGVRLAEVEALKEALVILEKGFKIESQTTGKQLVTTFSQYPNYPVKSELIDKLFFLEDIEKRIWQKKDFEKLIREIEGPKKAEKTLKNSYQKLQYYIQKKQVICIKYSRTHIFYSTHPEYVQKNENGFYLPPEHGPKSEVLEFIPEEKRNPMNIEWIGLN